MFKRFAPQLIRATRPAFARTLPNGFDYVQTPPADVNTGATVELPTELKLTLTRQDEFLFAAKVVKSVTLSSANGRMGVLPGHEYEVEKLEPGVLDVELMDGKIDKYAVSGGFAHINTDGQVDIITAEAILTTKLDINLLEKELASAQDLAKNGDEDSKVRGEIGVATLEPILESLKA